MISLLYLLFIIWLLIIVFLYKILLKFKVELSYLPQFSKKSIARFHPPIGLNINNIVIIPEEYKDSPMILMAVMPTCHACNKHFEEIYEFKQTTSINITFACIISKEEIGYKDYVEKYNNYVPIFTISDDYMENLYIKRFPSFFIINSKGEIVEVLYNSLAVIYRVKNMLSQVS